MTNVMDNFEKMEFLEVQNYENMTVIGLNTQDTHPPDLMPLDVGLDMGLVEITEINEAGSVGQLKVINNAVTPLLIMDGEEIDGAKQNRIVNSTIIIQAKTEQIINVSCTEAGRWNYNSKKFKHSNHFASSNVRRSKQDSINNSLKTTNQRISNQQEVWSNIELTQDLLDVQSTTNAQQDTYNSIQTRTDEYVKHFPVQEKQNASIIIINNQVVGMELLYNSKVYSRYHKRYMESYIIDAIAQHEECENEDASKLSQEFIEKMKNSKIEEYNDDNINDYRINNEEITGSLVYYEDNLINASILRKLDKDLTSDEILII